MLPLLLESAARSLILGMLVWASIKILLVRNIQARMIVWTGVLLASLSMPGLMHYVTVPIRVPAEPVAKIFPVFHAIQTVSSGSSFPGASRSDGVIAPSMPWLTVTFGIYSIIAGTLGLRLIVGLILTLKLRRTAHALREDWTANLDVRISPTICTPLTIASTILLPADCRNWTSVKRQAVLSHESSHVARRDFYIQLLAKLHRVVFWFTPLSWWLWSELTKLGEAASDDAAIRTVADRSIYAEILFEFARLPKSVPGGVAMARPTTLPQRVQRILSDKNPSRPIGLYKQIMATAALLPLIFFSAGWSWRQHDLKASARFLRAVATSPTLQGTTVTVQKKQSVLAPAKMPADQKTLAAVAPMNKQEPSIEINSDRGLYVRVQADTLIINGSRSQIIMNGDSLTSNRLKTKGDHEQQPENTADGYIRFEKDGTSFRISAPTIVEKAESFFRPIEELSLKQAEFGVQQGKLGEQQGRRGLETRGNEMGTRADNEDMQAALGEKQAKLGEEQTKLAEEQRHAAADAVDKLRALIADSLHNGYAKSEP